MEVPMAARLIELTIPQRMTPEEMARTFSACLLGAKVFEIHPGDHTAPFLIQKGYWQLDGSNDFWLAVDRDQPKKARISCRYESEIPALEAMAALFRWRFERYQRAAA